MPENHRPATTLSAMFHSTSHSRTIQVILVDDHEMVRAGISALLSMEPDIRVVAEARDGASLLALLEHTRVDVVVCDMAMPGMDGLETVERVHHHWPDVRVLVLSMDDSA